MNISEVLAAEVPEGIYRLTMQVIQNSLKQFLPLTCSLQGEFKLQMDKHIDSLCAAFEALMACAKGDRPLGDAEFCKQGYIQQGRSEAIKEILAGVKKLPIYEHENSGLGPERYASSFQEIVIAYIRALEVPSEQA